MSRRLQPSIPTVSLFPFLAVLLCTMGILVMMLVLAVKSADLQAQEQQAQKTAELVEQMHTEQQRLDHAEVTALGLSSIRPELIEKLKQAKLLRQTVEETIREFEQEQQKIAAALTQLQSKPSAEIAEDQLQAELEALQAKIKELEQERDETKPASDGPPLYSIVPYDGPTGTRRRPIYVECTQDGILLQPYGIRLSLNDFMPPLGPGNPLDAALMTIRDHWKNTNSAAEQGDPYPLLVVRSNGATSYNLARRAMTSWVDEFGYELIDKDLPLAYGTSEPELSEKLRVVIERAKQEQQVRAQAEQEFRQWQAMNGSLGGKAAPGPQGLMPDRVNGGFTRAGGRSGSPSAAGDLGHNSSVANRLGASPNNTNSTPGNRTALTGSADGQAEFNSSANNSSNGAAASGTSAASPGNTDFFATNSGQSGGQSGGQTQSAGATANAESAGGQSLSIANTQLPAIAAQRGANWALPNGSSGGTAYLRPIRIICDSRQISLNSYVDGEIRPQVIPWQTAPQQTMQDLVQAVWREMDQWGIAAANGYWKPELRIRVLPGGEDKFQAIQQLMDQSGFSIIQD